MALNRLMGLVRDKIQLATNLLRGSDLKARCARGGMALAAGTFVERGSRFVRTMILAKLLLPADLGIVALVTAAILIFEAVNEVGVRQSVIQNKKGDEDEYLNVAWWFQSMRTTFLFAGAFLLAPLISRFYAAPQMLHLLRVMLISMLFNGLMSPRAFVLEKQLRFSKAVVLVQGSGLLGTLVTVCLVLSLRNVWAIVIGFVVESLIRCVLSFLLCPFRPRLRIDRDCLRDILKFARGMLGLPILTLIAFQTDVVVLGKVVSKELVGMYFMAFQLARMPRELYARIVGSLLLPVFSKKQDDKATLCRAVLKMAKGTSAIVTPLMGFLIVCAGALLSTAYTPEYAEVSVPFCLLCMVILLRTQGLILVSTYLAIGQPQLHRGFVALRSAILVVLLYPGIVLGKLVGAASVVLLAEFVAFIAQIHWMRKRIGLRARDYFDCLLPGLWASLVVVMPVGAAVILGVEAMWLLLIMGAGFCAAACATGLLLIAKHPIEPQAQPSVSSSLDEPPESIEDESLIKVGVDT